MSELDPSFQNSSPTKTPKNSLDEEIDEDEESILDDQSIDDVGTIEENCDDNDDPFDWELEVPIDVSINSDSSQDDSDVSEFEIQEEAEEEVREDVFDKIIDAFTVKRRKAIIDLDQDSDLVDYEESQKRLFILATISRLLFSNCILSRYDFCVVDSEVFDDIDYNIIQVKFQ